MLFQLQMLRKEGKKPQSKGIKRKTTSQIITVRVVLKYEIEDACCIVLGHNQGQQGMTKDADADVLDRTEEAKPAIPLLKMPVGNWSKMSLKLCSETNIQPNNFKETEKAKQ